MLKTGDLVVRYCIIIPHARYRHNQTMGEDCQGNKINLVVEESSGTEASVY